MPPFGRFRIDVVEVLEAGRIFDVAEQRQRVAPCRLALPDWACAASIAGGGGESQSRGKCGDGAGLEKTSSGNGQMQNSCC